MPENRSAVEVLRILVERVRRIESEAGFCLAVLEKMAASIERQRSAAAAGSERQPPPPPA